MKLAVLTLSRGEERKEFVTQTRRMLSRQTRPPEAWYLVNHPPVDDKVDILARIRTGLDRAIKDGIGMRSDPGDYAHPSDKMGLYFAEYLYQNKLLAE